MNMQAPTIHPDEVLRIPYEDCGDMDVECIFQRVLDRPGLYTNDHDWHCYLSSVRIERAYVKPEDVFTEGQIEALERQAVEACG